MTFYVLPAVNDDARLHILAALRLLQSTFAETKEDRDACRAKAKSLLEEADKCFDPLDEDNAMHDENRFQMLQDLYDQFVNEIEWAAPHYDDGKCPYCDELIPAQAVMGDQCLNPSCRHEFTLNVEGV